MPTIWGWLPSQSQVAPQSTRLHLLRPAPRGSLLPSGWQYRSRGRFQGKSAPPPVSSASSRPRSPGTGLKDRREKKTWLGSRHPTGDKSLTHLSPPLALRFHSPRLCRAAVFLIQTNVSLWQALRPYLLGIYFKSPTPPHPTSTSRMSTTAFMLPRFFAARVPFSVSLSSLSPCQYSQS